MRQGIKTDVSNAVQRELSVSMEKFPLFNSAHEGYAVILEEIEEAQQELGHIKIRLEVAWNAIKNNQDATSTIEDAGYISKLLACEAIQVAAMAKKFEESAKNWRN